MIIKIIAIIVWLIIFISLLTCSLNLISRPNNFLNIVGIILLTINVAVSSKCYKMINK